MASQNLQKQIEGFINTQVVSRGLDERTAIAYRMDLEQFHSWMELKIKEKREQAESGHLVSQVLTDLQGVRKKPESGIQPGLQLGEAELQEKRCLEEGKEWGYEEWMEKYLNYLSEEKGLRTSTISRRHRVFRYYLAYLAKQGLVERYRPLKLREQPKLPKEISLDRYLTKKEIDRFFLAIQQEYEELDSEFRRRVCLRDQVMMELLFYHRLEVSELLRLEVSDYNRKTAVLTVPRKREKERTVYLFSKELQGRMAQWLDDHDYFEHDEMYQNRMFLSKLGKPLSMKMVVNIFEKYRGRAGIEKACTPKDLKNGLGRYAVEVVREMG